MNFFDAIRNGDLQIVIQLVKANPVLLESVNEKGFPPLILSTYNDQFEISNFLIEQKIDVDKPDASGNTALMGVVFKGYKNIVELLLKKGADVNKQNFNGATALIFAATFGSFEIAEILIHYKADKNIKDNRGNTALKHAYMQGNQKLIDLLEL